MAGIPRRSTDGSERIDDRELRIAFLAVRLYAETHPRPAQVTQKRAAEILGVSTRTVRRHIRSGHLRLNGCGYGPFGREVIGKENSIRFEGVRLVPHH